MTKSRKEAIFKLQKRIAEAKGETFPYSNYDEWNADSECRRREWLAYANQKHKWLEAGLFNDEIFYNFFDPETSREYTAHLHHDTCAEFWSVSLTYEDGDDEHEQWITKLLHGYYEYEDLLYLKIDLIRCLEVMFPAVTGWNDEFLKHGK